MMTAARIYNGVMFRVIKRSFPFWEALGFHVTPNHFYQPIPDSRTLTDSLWSDQSRLVGVDMNDEDELQLLSTFSLNYRKEYGAFPQEKTDIPYQYYVNNNLFELVDGGILYCMIRHFKPRKIIEIGSGYSTLLSAQAILKNEDEDRDRHCELTAIEPYPNSTLRAGFPGLTRLEATKLQNIPLSEFDGLGENDILFIDSSHVMKIGSDVQYEILDILPRLNKGVIVHVHDIFLPAEYPKGWVLKDHVFVNEQYFLHAFLIFNDHFRVLWGGHYMQLRHSAELKAAFGRDEVDERWPCSFWIKKVK